MSNSVTRRRALLLGAAACAAPAVLRAQDFSPIQQGGVDRNASAFLTQRWEDHFDKLGVATLLADTGSRALHYWSADGSDYRLYPTSVPKTDELTRRGHTTVVRKVKGPDWTPTASMREADPSLPAYMPPGEGNPLGTHALYLGWPAYLIHGTHDTRKIGRRSSSGCIGLYNRMIAEVFELVPVGAQVRLI
ncbi:L,D-transpeptidase [Mesobaculum littorinae]|uniref:L,D-transpeptidase n=1 Tax=Mesobaculum littorinae TaxID=2486419 RepID=A0A438AKX1_9RHOB|nr:L,D-transpeptidase [Mesobaculum littorinae]RVV99471.1 L,D-transpeptidase [Mesobaculum littorinae]